MANRSWPEEGCPAAVAAGPAFLYLWPGDPAGSPAHSSAGLDDAHRAVVVVARACAEHQRRGPGERGVADHEAPHARYRDRVADGVPQHALELPGHRVERVDPAVPQVPHQQITGERA